MSVPMDPRCFWSIDPGGWLHIVTACVFPILSAFGTVGDVLMLLTIRYGHLSDSPYVYLKFVAMADLIQNLFLMSSWAPYCATCNFSVGTMYYLLHYLWYCYLVIVNAMGTWLKLLTLFLTVERFVCVRWPMQTRSLCTRKRATKLCVGILLVSCCSRLPSILNTPAIVIVNDRYLGAAKTSSQVSEFFCDPKLNETSSERSFTCFNDRFPVDSVSVETDSHCNNYSRKSELSLRRSPRTEQLPFSPECLNQRCELPQLQEDQVFLHLYKYEKRPILQASSMDAKILAVTNDSTLGGHFHLLPREKFIGRGLLIDGDCVFVLIPSNSKLNFSDIRHPYLWNVDTVPCVTGMTRSEWPNFIVFQEHYEQAWLWFEAFFSTMVLSTLNVLIVILVRRANRRAAGGVLSNNEQSTTLKRRREENRLTMSLVSLSCVKILCNVVHITSWDRVGFWIYKGIPAPGSPLMIHKALASVLYTAQYSSYFFLLAFFNRKFREEFLQRVVHGKWRLREFFGRNRAALSTPTRTRVERIQERNNATSSGHASNIRAQVEQPTNGSGDQAV